MPKDQLCKPVNLPKNQVDDNTSREFSLLLFNDDYHTFDFVIECLVEICGHDYEQAEQCAYLVHYRGSCKVATGKYNIILSMHDALAEKGLKVKISRC